MFSGPVGIADMWTVQPNPRVHRTGCIAGLLSAWAAEGVERFGGFL